MAYDSLSMQILNQQPDSGRVIASTTVSGGEIIAGPGITIGGGGSNVGSDSANIPEQDVSVSEPVTLAARSHSGTVTVRSSLRMAELR